MNDLKDFIFKTGTKPGQKQINLFSLQPSVDEDCKEKKIMFFSARAYIDFKPPKLHQTGPEWYVYYSVKDPCTHKFRRYRIKVNRGGKVERRAAARQIMASLAERLSLGWTPYAETTSRLSIVPLFDILDAFEKIRAKEMRQQSVDTYRSFLRVFRKWLKDNRADETTLVSVFDWKAAISYMDYIENKPHVSPRTYNNYLSFQVTLFDWMKDKGYVSENPFLKIRRKPKFLMKKTRRTLTEDELSTLFDYLEDNNTQFLAICLLCLCCLLRPKEIALLRCSDIDLSRQVVHVASEVAKNRKESFRTIPSAVVEKLRRLNLQNPQWYIFGRHLGDASDFSPGREPVSKKKFSDFWDNYVRPACGFGNDLQFYSLKDTGITRMLGEKVPISFVQQQADHSSVAMTAVYVGKSALAMDELKAVDILPRREQP